MRAAHGPATPRSQPGDPTPGKGNHRAVAAARASRNWTISCYRN
jgi:hypothetical protein